jgi:chorismate synthase
MTLRYLTAGESHGPAITTILEGIPAGLELPNQVIDKELARRQRGYGAGDRMKIEKDQVKLLGGVMAGVTTGAPIAMLIENKDHSKWAGKKIPPMTVPRPGHADLTAAIKYGYPDLRLSLERASARETAACVAVGAVCKHFLAQFDIQIGGYVAAIGEVKADLENIPLGERAALAERADVRCPDLKAAEKMRARIEKIIKAKDTLGGLIEVFALGLPPGLGSHVHADRRLDARLGAAILGIQAIKGVEIGDAFENSRKTGTQVQDEMFLDGNAITRKSNHAGGIEGGISNGQPLLIRAAMKPIATTLTPQRSIDLVDGKEAKTEYERSDFCPVPRAVPIIEGVIAIVLAQALIEKLGGDSMAEMTPRFAALRKARLEDLQMDNEERIWWSK